MDDSLALRFPSPPTRPPRKPEGCLDTCNLCILVIILFFAFTFHAIRQDDRRKGDRRRQNLPHAEERRKGDRRKGRLGAYVAWAFRTRWNKLVRRNR
jgi:cbb3-type cytochrome oxidase subunit 3